MPAGSWNGVWLSFLNKKNINFVHKDCSKKRKGRSSHGLNEIQRLIHIGHKAHFNRDEGQERLVKVNTANGHEMKYRLRFGHNTKM